MCLACPAPAQPAPDRISAIAVDVTPLRAAGLGPYADRVGAALKAELGRAFADKRGPGPRMVVRVDAVSMRAYAGSDGRVFGGGALNTDYLEGAALILDGRGAVIATYPQLSAVPASSGGAWYDPASEGRRVDALAAHFAGWLRRKMP